MRIFLVEDHVDTLRYLSLYLESAGHQVQSANCMADALAKLPYAKYDVLISDLGLPDGDGWELLARAGSACPAFAIALSGFGTKADHAKSHEAGFRVHLVKPVDPDNLAKVLRAASEELALVGKE